MDRVSAGSSAVLDPGPLSLLRRSSSSRARFMAGCGFCGLLAASERVRARGPVEFHRNMAVWNSPVATMTRDIDLAVPPTNPNSALGYADTYALWKADQEASTKANTSAMPNTSFGWHGCECILRRRKKRFSMKLRETTASLSFAPRSQLPWRGFCGADTDYLSPRWRENLGRRRECADAARPNEVILSLECRHRGLG